MLSWLFSRGISPLRPLERELIGAVAARLAPPARKRLESQLALVNRVQRHADDKEVNLYAMKGGKVHFPAELLFPLRGEAKLASVQFKDLKGSVDYKADIWLANGHIFSIEFSRSPRDLSPDAVRISDVKILVDPMGIATTSGTEPSVEEKIEAKLLPRDYADLVKDTKGRDVDGVRVLEPRSIRSLVMEDANYAVIAEVQDRGVLAIKKDSSSPTIYFLGYEDQRPRALGTSLREAIERLRNDPMR